MKLRRVALGRVVDVSITFTTKQANGILLAAGESEAGRGKREVDLDQTEVSSLKAESHCSDNGNDNDPIAKRTHSIG